jgi:hypothetical protein
LWRGTHHINDHIYSNAATDDFNFDCPDYSNLVYNHDCDFYYHSSHASNLHDYFYFDIDFCPNTGSAFDSNPNSSNRDSNPQSYLLDNMDASNIHYSVITNNIM